MELYKRLGIVFIILIIFYSLFQLIPNEKEEVLKHLLEKGEYCKFIKKEGDEYFLFCNERPFYAKIENGNVTFDKNGWEFLEKDEKMWNDLKDCDFYKSVKAKEDEYNLIFYCPKDLFSQPKEMIAKTYSFDTNSFEMTKTGEGNFFNILEGDLKEFYGIEKCEMKSIGFINESIIPFSMDIVFDCGGVDYRVLFDLSNLGVLQPPILIDETKSDLEIIQTSFENIFEECYIEYINYNYENINVDAVCKDRKVYLTYTPLDNYYLMRYEIEIKDASINEIKDAIKTFGKYSMFPPYEFEDISSIGNELYLLDEKVYNIVVCNGKLRSVGNIIGKNVVYHSLIKVPRG